MSYPQARIDLSVNAQGAINGTRQAVQAFNQLEQKGKQAVATLDTGINQTTNSMARLESQTTRTTASFQRNGMAMLAIGTSYAGAYTAISNLDKAMQRVSKAELGLQRARDLQQTTTISIQRLESQLNKLREEGKTNTDTYTLALAKLELQQQKLGTATNDLAVKEEELRIQQGALTDTQILFATMMINTVVSSIALGRQAVEGLSLAQVKNRIQTALTTKTYYANAIGLKTMGTASIFSISGLKGLMTTQKLLNISMGKWLLIATGVILAYEGIAHVIKMLNPEVDITIEKLSGDLFSAMDKAQMKAMGMSDEMIATSETMTEFGTTAQNAGEGVVALGNVTSETAGKITGLATGFGSTSEAILKFHEELSGKGLEDLNNRVDAINMVFEALGNNIDKNSEEWKRAVHGLIPEIGKIADELSISSKQGALEFVRNMKKMTGDTTGELDKLIEKISEVDSAMSDALKKKRQIDEDEDVNSFDNIMANLKNSEAITKFNTIAGQIQREAMMGNQVGVNYLSGQLRNMIATYNSQQNISSAFKNTGLNNLATLVSNQVNEIYRAQRALGTLPSSKSTALRNVFSQFGISQATANYVANLNKAVNTSTYKSNQGFGGTSKFAGRTLTRSKGKKKRGRGINWEQRMREQGFAITGGTLNESILRALTGINVSTESFIQRFVGRGWSLAPVLKKDALISALEKARLIRSDNRKMVTDEIVSLEKLYGFDLYDENNIPILLENMYLEGLFDNAGNLPRDFQSKYAQFLSGQITDIRKEFEYKRQQTFFAGYSDIFKNLFGEDIDYDMAVRDSATTRMFSDILKFANKSRYQTIGT